MDFGDFTDLLFEEFLLAGNGKFHGPAFNLVIDESQGMFAGGVQFKPGLAYLFGYMCTRGGCLSQLIMKRFSSF